MKVGGNIGGMIGFEIAETFLVKIHDNSHRFTQTHVPAALTVDQA